MDLRRKTVRLREEQILRILNLPEGTQVRAVQGQFDPPSILVGLTHPEWPEVPPDSEAPIAQVKAFRYPSGQVAITLDDLPDPVDPYQEQDDKLRELLAYCLSDSEPRSLAIQDAADAYEDVAEKLRGILGGSA